MDPVHEKDTHSDGRPLIIVVSADTDDEFRWLSGGWYTRDKQHTTEAQYLWRLAKEAIEAGTDVPDTINRLEEAGFKVVRSENGLI